MNSLLENLIGRSPIQPIQEHMSKVHQCVAMLQEFLQASTDNDWGRAAELQGEIQKLENDADDMKNEIRSHLSRSLLLPFARADLIALITVQDKLANKAKDIAGLILGRQMEIPPILQDSFFQYFRYSLETSDKAKTAIDELDKLLETGFGSRGIELVESLVNDLGDIEHQSDLSQIELRRQLRDLEATLPPVDIIFIYKVIDLVGELADVSQRIGNRLTLLLSR